MIKHLDTGLVKDAITIIEADTFRILAELPNDNTGKEDAEMICKTVNLFPELVEMLQRVKYVIMLHSGKKVFSDSFEDEIRDLLNKIKP